MNDNWSLVYKSNNLQDAEIVKAVLIDNEIEAVLLNKTDSMHMHLTNGEIEVYCSKNSFLKAKHLITKHQL